VQGFLRRFRDTIQVPRIKEIGSLQVDTRYLTFSLKKLPKCQIILPEKNDLCAVHSDDVLCNFYALQWCTTIDQKMNII